MKFDAARYLVCPKTKSDLEVEVVEEESGEVKTGWLHAKTGGERYPITAFVPRFVDRDQYASTFSLQRLYVRRHFEDYRHDRSGHELFLPTTGFTAEGVRSGLSLEVGCGYGRFVRVVQDMGGEIFGLDLSTHSIELASDYVGRLPRVHLVQADLFNLPFRGEQFARVFSIGVLHHTPDTRKAFEAIVPYVAKGGQVSIWLYHPDDKRLDDKWRRVTTRMPPRSLYAMCVVNQALFAWMRALPGGWRIPIPVAAITRNSTFWTRVLSDFDSLSPTYAYTHTHDEVTRWFKEVGLSCKALERRTAVTGWKAR